MNKLDGASCLMNIDLLNNGKVTLYSKGDGETDCHIINHILRYSKNINTTEVIKNAREIFKKYNNFYLRGEIIM